MKTLSSVLLALCCTAPLAALQPAPDLLEVPAVIVSGMEPAVRDQLLAERTRLDGLLASGGSPEELRQSFGVLGQLYLVYDLLAPAEACLENASRLAPDGGFPFVYLLGTLQQHEGRYREAEATYERALALRKDDLATLLRLGEVRIQLDEWDAAAEPLERALTADAGGEAFARWGLGRIAWEAGDRAAALAHFERALELQPEASILHYHIALAQAALGQTEASRESMSRRGEVTVRFPDPIAGEVKGAATGVGALLVLSRLARERGELENAEALLRQAVELDPESAPARRALAGLLERSGRAEEALEQYATALDLDPEIASEQGRLGFLLSRAGRDEEAIGHYREALRLAPDFEGGKAELALALARLGKDQEALDTLARMESLDLELRDLEVRLLIALDRKEEALPKLRQILAERPDHVASRLQLARLEQETGHLDAARREYERLLDPSFAPTQRAIALFNLGNLDAESAPERAIDRYRQAIELDPSQAEVHFNLATMLGRVGSFPEATEAYRRVLEIDPTHRTAAVGAGMSLVLAGRYAEARAHLEKYLSSQEDNAPLAHLLARLLACAPDDAVRDGELGLQLALQIVDAYPSPDHAETVAMALAEAGRFEDAVRWQRQLVAEIERAGRNDLLAEARRRLALYEAGKAERSPWETR